MNIVFLGTSDIAVPSLRSLATSKHKILAVVTQPDRPKGRSLKTCEPPVKTVAGEYGLRVIQPENINTQETVLQLQELQPDFVVVVSYGQILSSQIISVPKQKCINMHASLLPKYRGAAPINRAIINGEEVTGVTIMAVVERMDAGDIIAQSTLSIHPDETAGELTGRLASLGAEALLSVLEQFEDGTAVFSAQDEAGVTYAKKFKKEDCRIDWNQDAKVVHDFVRGLTPRPGAYTFLSSEGRTGKKTRVNVIKTEIGLSTLDGLDGKPTPGSIIETSERGLNVAATGSSVWITTLQPEGKRAMSAAEFARGRKIKPGDRFCAEP